MWKTWFRKSKARYNWEKIFANKISNNICKQISQNIQRTLTQATPLKIGNLYSMATPGFLPRESLGQRSLVGLLSMVSHRVGHDWSDLACMHAVEKAMATHSSTLAWKIPWMEEPGRVRHNWATSLSLSTLMHGEGNGNPLQCSRLENPRDGRAWWAAVYGVAQSRTQLKWLSSSSSVRVVSSAYLRLLILLPAVLIPACASSILAFRMMYSV